MFVLKETYTKYYPYMRPLGQAWEHTTLHFFAFFVGVEFFASSPRMWRTKDFFAFFSCEEFFYFLTYFGCGKKMF